MLGKAGAFNANNGINTTIDTTQRGGDATQNGGTTDGTIRINQLQGPNDRANDWAAFVTVPNSICNSPYTVSVRSANAGLTYTGTPSTNAAFANKLVYQISVNFEGKVGVTSTNAMTPGVDKQLVTSPDGSVGVFRIDFRGYGDARYLLAGTYQDNVLITLSANV